MAKLDVLPHEDIISGFKGVIDFYVHDGIPCARKWPRSPGHKRAPRVEAQWNTFAYSSRLWNELSLAVRDAYNKMAQDTALSGRDWFTRTYISGTYRYPVGIPIE